MNDSSLTLQRADDGDWLAVDAEGLVIGRGGTSRRPGFISVDAWSAPAFDLIAAAILAELPLPLCTLVAAGDDDLLAAWRRHGFAERRREVLYRIPFDPDGPPPPIADLPVVRAVRPHAGRPTPFLAADVDAADRATIDALEAAGGSAVETTVELVRA
ncbi:MULTISPECIES: hypothetical protein [Tsukamurella]|uniref:GNAT family N-acetyltransferase n=2 Tax=Tsukamurella TaxID=2060 RepID=A0A138AW56_9ACTN|nr:MULTISPECIES: hypothetical protein [Tsukamurella]KXO91156.1 hypothetical protein AXK61_06185 [Tsukamurella pseudospumae]KXP14670.1 hypothetical protein AXK60_01915 [Tsukamurella pseudospumae]NKY20366.1 hypothetical protein [Tsukamurella spumae]